ncbi:uncharacterized protein CG13380-like [Drosophila willistoni]|uniref:uncharacterized protein CG13380-like n=1 Tax=Drosophila willistoni TaxID=7260 RepID=UPI001F07ACF9|nr:uncharacterized protein CG13380-like [Drosophila willistoni]
MNRCPHCFGTGKELKRNKSTVNKRLDRCLNGSKCLGPNDETDSVEPDCICHRPQHAYECDRCHQFFHGRLTETCPQHKSEIYLMDFQCCPYCAAPKSMIQIAKFTWEQICKFENAELPGGDEGL